MKRILIVASALALMSTTADAALLQFDFSVLDDSLWNGPQPVSILETNSSGVPAHDDVAATGVYEGVGTIERTVLIADPIAPSVPEPSTWAMLLIGFAGFGFAANWRRGPFFVK